MAGKSPPPAAKSGTEFGWGSGMGSFSLVTDSWRQNHYIRCRPNLCGQALRPTQVPLGGAPAPAGPMNKMRMMGRGCRSHTNLSIQRTASLTRSLSVLLPVHNAQATLQADV